MRTFACWSARNLMDLYEQARLTAGAARRVRAHLSRCAGCRSLAAETEGLQSLLKGAGAAAPAGLAASILRRLQEGGPPPRPALRGWRPRPLQAAAFAGLLALAASHALWETPTQPPEPSPAPEALPFTSPLDWEAPR